MSEQSFLTVGEVAARLRVSQETVRRLLRAGELRGLRIGKRAGYRIATTDLDTFVQRGKDRGASVRPAD